MFDVSPDPFTSAFSLQRSAFAFTATPWRGRSGARSPAATCVRARHPGRQSPALSPARPPGRIPPMASRIRRSDWPPSAPPRTPHALVHTSGSGKPVDSFPPAWAPSGRANVFHPNPERRAYAVYCSFVDSNLSRSGHIPQAVASGYESPTDWLCGPRLFHENAPISRSSDKVVLPIEKRFSDANG